jgi:hypothetical protein
MVVLPSPGASLYHNCCIDGCTSPEYFGYIFIYPKRHHVTSHYPLTYVCAEKRPGEEISEMWAGPHSIIHHGRQPTTYSSVQCHGSMKSTRKPFPNRSAQRYRYRPITRCDSFSTHNMCSCGTAVQGAAYRTASLPIPHTGYQKAFRLNYHQRTVVN